MIHFFTTTRDYVSTTHMRLTQTNFVSCDRTIVGNHLYTSMIWTYMLVVLSRKKMFAFLTFSNLVISFR